MPFTELVFASLKPGIEIRACFDEWIPKLVSAAATANVVFATHSVPLETEDSVPEAQKLWDAFVEKLKLVEAGALQETASGPSVNLEERKFVGIVGWKNEATRLKSLGNDDVEEQRNALEKGGKVETFTAQF